MGILGLPIDLPLPKIPVITPLIEQNPLQTILNPFSLFGGGDGGQPQQSGGGGGGGGGINMVLLEEIGLGILGLGVVLIGVKIIFK